MIIYFFYALMVNQKADIITWTYVLGGYLITSLILSLFE